MKTLEEYYEWKWNVSLNKHKFYYEIHLLNDIAVARSLNWCSQGDKNDQID